MTGGRMAKHEGTWAAAPERPRRGKACCLSPKGELHASSAGADEPRSSAQLATARRRPAPARKSEPISGRYVGYSALIDT